MNHIKPLRKKYHGQTAGSLMTLRVPIFDVDYKIADIYSFLSKHWKKYDSLVYVYFIDNNHHLKGVMSVKEIFRHNLSRSVESVMNKNTKGVLPTTNKEQVALMALSHGIKAVPVVDGQKKLLGVVTIDALLETLHAEGVENLLRVGGVDHENIYDNIFRLSIWTSVKHRLPWLLIGLMGGIGAAGIIGSFEETLVNNLVLASFIPLVVYISAAVGAQMQTLMIRDMSVNHKLKFFKYFFRQGLVVLIMGIIISLVMYFFGNFWYGQAMIMAVISAAIFCAMISSLFMGLIIPYLFGKFRLDPANASGPIGTIIQDILSVVIYLSIASALLN